MFEYLYLNRALEIIKELPREVVIGVTAYAITSEMYKQHSRTKRVEIEANAKVRAIELEVEKLRLQLELRDRGLG